MWIRVGCSIALKAKINVFSKEFILKNVAANSAAFLKLHFFLILEHTVLLLHLWCIVVPNFNWSGCGRFSQVNRLVRGIRIQELGQPQNVDIVVIIKMTPPSIIWKIRPKYFSFHFSSNTNTSNQQC